MSESMMKGLVRFFLEQIAEDEQRARAATTGPWSVDDRTYPEAITAEDGTSVVAGGRWGGEASVFEEDADALHIAEWDPDRALAECAAKRRIVEEYRIAATAKASRGDTSAGVGAFALGMAIRALAEVYTRRAGYLEVWRFSR